MKRVVLRWVWVLAGAVAFTAGRPSEAAPPKKGAKPAVDAPPPVPPDAPLAAAPIKLFPDGARWVMSRGDLEGMVDKLIDDDARPLYKKTPPGPAMLNLDARVADQKAAFRRSYIDLTGGPTGLDSSPLAAEYSKGNGEALMSHTRGPGVRIWFFFMNGHLWKTLEEVNLVDGGLYGKNITEAAVKLVDSVGGTLPRTIPADPDHGQYYVLNDWQDPLTHMRVWDRSGTLVIVREQKETVARLPSLRRVSQATASDRLDPSVAAALRPPEPPPPDKTVPPPDANKKKLARGPRVARARVHAQTLLPLCLVLGVACSRPKGTGAGPAASSSVALGAEGLPSASGSAAAPASGSVAASASTIPVEPAGPCAPGMLFVKGSYCIDKYEAALVDKETREPLSPYYPPIGPLARKLEAVWEERRKTLGSPAARALAVPALPTFQREHDPDPMAAEPRAGVVPNGYVSGLLAARACANAGKRLCRYDEWVGACRGEQNRAYPYGSDFTFGACNIARDKHPAAILHDDASAGHLDPRLNLTKDGDDPLLRPTGATEHCVSQWGTDGVWDMNGNLDEWVEDAHGRFVGGFFSRWRKDGCAAGITTHPNEYFDYSTGVRCCADPEG